MTVSLSRTYTFSASHRLHAAGLSDEENQAIFGKCNNPHGHGHNYEVRVTVTGSVGRVTGRVVSLAILDSMTEEHVLKPLRYSNLNEEIEAFRDVVPTTENLALEVERRLRKAWLSVFGPDGPSLERISIWETERNICEIGAS